MASLIGRVLARAPEGQCGRRERGRLYWDAGVALVAETAAHCDALAHRGTVPQLSEALSSVAMSQPLHRLVNLAAALVLLQASDVTCSSGDAFAPDGIRVTGLVVFLRIEGGCWQLQADNGARYELRPDQAPPKMLVDGARVTLLLYLRTDLASFCAVGQIADVERVESVRLP